MLGLALLSALCLGAQVFVMAPLTIIDNNGNIQDRDKIVRWLNQLQSGNVDGLISFHPDGSIRTFIITGHAETPGLGSNAMDRQEEKTLVSLFRKETKRSGLPPNRILDQYSGHSAGTSDSWKKPWKLTKDGGQAEYLSGATISSKAVNRLAWKAASTFEANRQALTGKIQEVSK